MKSRGIWLAIALAAVLLGVFAWRFAAPPADDAATAATARPRRRPVDCLPRPSRIAEADPEGGAAGEDASAEDAADEADDEPESEPLTEAEQRVEDFDGFTDAWTEPSAKEIAMKDVARFHDLFVAVPKDRREECLQRALNLVPDENVMLLAGVLLDKSLDHDLLELVFNDVLNRDENVKMPLLREILKDRNHPCRDDAAWILDATDDASPSKKE